MLVKSFKRLFKEKPLGTVGFIIVVLMVIIAIFADVLAPYGYAELNMKDSLLGPSSKYLLGTDNLGRDQLSRIIYGARISMMVGIIASAIEAALATLLGLTSGYFGGKIDIIIQRFVDAWMCFPSLFLILSVMAITGPGLTQTIVILGLLGGVRSSRVVRGTVIGVKQNMYVQAAGAIGASSWQVIRKHILHNIAPVVIIIFTIAMGAQILSEATISFLGFGVPPPTPTWGGMLSGAGRTYMFQAPWLALWPGLALSIVVYGVNMFGDALRDILDPKLVGGAGRYGTKKKKIEVKAKTVKAQQ